MRWKPLNILIEKLRIGYLFRRAYGAYCNQRYPDYDLFNALALKSGLPGSDVFKFTTDGAEVTLWPMGQHLDQHGNDEIVDLGSLRWDFEKPDGKINWIAKFRLYEAKYLTEFVKEGPVRIHYLPEARRLAIGGGRNRLLALMRLGYINYPGKPVWDDIPPDTSRQGWVDKTKRWEDAWRQGLKLTLKDVYEAVFRAGSRASPAS